MEMQYIVSIQNYIIPYLHYSIDQRLFTLETCCGYGYELVLIKIIFFSERDCGLLRFERQDHPQAAGEKGNGKRERWRRTRPSGRSRSKKAKGNSTRKNVIMLKKKSGRNQVPIKALFHIV
jgi:hypothetical protein